MNLDELVQKQLKIIDVNKRLKYNDLKRIAKYVPENQSLFDPNKCCIWSGYITNAEHSNKGVYVNFYFEGKKIALHRLLYINYVGQLDDNDYLKFCCDNKGRCCNIHHLQKFKYVSKQNDKQDIKLPIINVQELVNEPNEFIINFD